jgi:dienelactone hydrolase
MLFEMPVVFHSQGVPLVGRVFRDRAALDVRQPAVIAMGSWLTVKEQMASIYARRLAEAGYTALVFDFSRIRREPRCARKIQDIDASALWASARARSTRCALCPDRRGVTRWPK